MGLRLSPDGRVRLVLLALLIVGRGGGALQTAEEFLQVGHVGWWGVVEEGAMKAMKAGGLSLVRAGK